LGKGDRKSRKGKIWRKSYGKYRMKKPRKKSSNRIKKIQQKNNVRIDWDERMQYLNEYLRNGGLEKMAVRQM
jgi:30S ribosomal protein S31